MQHRRLGGYFSRLYICKFDHTKRIGILLSDLIYVCYLEYNWKQKTNRVALKSYRLLADKNDKVVRFLPFDLEIRFDGVFRHTNIAMKKFVRCTLDGLRIDFSKKYKFVPEP